MKALTMFGGTRRLEELRVMCAELHAAGVTLSVCSFNGRKVIEPLLSDAGLLPFFPPELIFGCEVCVTSAPCAPRRFASRSAHMRYSLRPEIFARRSYEIGGGDLPR